MPNNPQKQKELGNFGSFESLLTQSLIHILVEMDNLNTMDLLSMELVTHQEGKTK
jgi:hypothetical protein